MKTQTVLSIVLAAALGLASSGLAAETSGKGEPQPVRTYEVDKKVKDFPEQEDLSTPEATYAACCRITASGEQGAWNRLSCARIRDRLPKDAKKEEVKPEKAAMWLNARILEVKVCKGEHAAVMAELQRDPKPPVVDIRYFTLEKGRWLNDGQPAPVPTLAEARGKVIRGFAEFFDRPVRPAVGDPASYLKPFVEFLEKHGQDPKPFIMKALGSHKVVIMGEIHHRPRYWALNASLVSDPDFAKSVGTIYMELPSNDQNLVDQFLGSEVCDTKPVIEMLRDNLWMGWPDQPMLDFFMTVWRVNQDLPTDQRLRIVLVDMQRPWKDIKERGDWRKYDDNRDKLMAENILKDLREHPQEGRNVLFIVGVGHTATDLKFFEGTPLMTAGWHLKQAMGQQVYACFPHHCVMTNYGDVKGRLCWGLFESAFAALNNKPLAFPLDSGPFGEQPYDADPEEPVTSTYRDGFDAYLYLGPIEYELFSPLIAGFYTDEFVKELDRRYRMDGGVGLVEGCHLAKLDAESFIGWMSRSWGRPRMDWSKLTLGPIDAWQRGGRDWKQAIRDKMHQYAREHPEVIEKAARDLIEAIRTADYDRDWVSSGNGATWEMFLPQKAHPYCVGSGYDAWVLWICKNFKGNPIQSVELGKVFWGKKLSWDRSVDCPVIPYKLTLKDGTVLEGNLPFYYCPQLEAWHGLEGLDWHAKYPNGLPAKH